MNQELITSMTSAIKYVKGEVMLREGTISDKLGIIVAGNAALYKNFGTTSAILNSALTQDGFFGEQGVLLGIPNEFSVVAMSDVVVLHFKREALPDFVKKHPETTIGILKTLCSKTLGNPLQQPAAPPVKPVAPPQSTAVSPVQVNAPKPSLAPSAPIPGLFPEWHGDCDLKLAEDSREIVVMRSYTCPLCGKEFKANTVRQTKLVTARTDDDMRTRYKNIEPLHYDVVTCPACYYSALTEQFPKGLRSKSKVWAEKIGAFKPSLSLHLDESIDSRTVFAQYYLALLCAPVCLDRSEMALALLWLKLSRLYQDSEAREMDEHATGEALKAYTRAYETLEVGPETSQRLFLTLGELNLRLGKVNDAKNFFYKAKVQKPGSAALSKQADNRIEDIREASKQADEV